MGSEFLGPESLARGRGIKNSEIFKRRPLGYLS
jgi:hypothetical protein